MRRATVIFVLAMVGMYSGSANAGEYHIDTTEHRLVRFISDAPLDDFEGFTDRIDGFVYFPANSLRAGADYAGSEFYFEVDLSALDTGIGLRNRHMRENYLETDEYPFARYAGIITEVSAPTDSSYLVVIKGELSIHGISRSLVDTISAISAGDDYRVRAEFPVALPDFSIDVPKLMFLKINEVVKLELEFYLRHITAEHGVEK